MKRKFPRPVTIALAALLAASGVRAAQAQEKETSREGLQEAQKDFATIKAARDPALQLKADLPRMNAPEWHGGTAPAPATGTRAKAATKKLSGEAKSKNWLVDAMQKSNSPRDQRENAARNDGESERDPLVGPRDFQTDRDDPREQLIAGDEPAKKKETPPVAQEKVVNPLTTYLADWMTPQDHALLKPGLASPTSNLGLPNAGGSSLSPVASALPGSVSASPAGPSSPAMVVPVLPAPRENPYLQTIAAMPTPAMPVLPPLVKVPAPVSVAGLPNVAAPTPAPVPPPAKIPEFARPVADDKYFKQLKRF